MAVEHQFRYRVPEGQRFVTFEEWTQNLPADQNLEFNQARQRQEAHRQAAIDRGDLIRDWSKVDISDPTSQPTYIWKDAETEHKNKPADPVWLQYWDRYLTETNTTFEIVKVEI